MKNTSFGFVMKELFIALLVVAGLAVVAFPAYRDYMRRDYYKGIVEATTPFKVAVNKCFKKLKTFTGCDTGTHAIPASINKPHGALASLVVKNGVIIAVPVPLNGIKTTDNYVLTPKIENDDITWVPSGAGLEHGYTG